MTVDALGTTLQLAMELAQEVTDEMVSPLVGTKMTRREIRQLEERVRARVDETLRDMSDAYVLTSRVSFEDGDVVVRIDVKEVTPVAGRRAEA